MVYDFYIKKKYPILSAVLKKVRTDGISMEAGSVCGNFFEAWDSPKKKQAINYSSTNNMTLLNNNIHILQAIYKQR